MKKILIAGALPYANGSLHIGHIASLLPGDVLARYHRLKGDRVFYVSGSDCYGTPVAIRAKQEGRTPWEISDGYHNEFIDDFGSLGFSFDSYIKTSSQQHRDFAQEFHKQLYRSKYIYEKTAPQAYCPRCRKNLTDRLIKGICPECGTAARGDQCDACGFVPEANQLSDPECAECGSHLEFRESKHLYIALSQLGSELASFVDGSHGWRKNAVSFTRRYIDEGLRDRAVTRDLDWGIPVPGDGYENKKIYIWAENVLAYLSASQDFFDVWTDNDAVHYYIHGKDNIPFHTIILPALLIAFGENAEKFHLPDKIFSSEYITLEGKKISTSNNWAIWIRDLTREYNPDTIRYFFIANGPEKRDTDFSWSEFKEQNNSELLGAYGNFVNRSLVFIEKYFGGKVPAGRLEKDIEKQINELYKDVGQKIESGCFRDGLEELFRFVRQSNKYFDSKQPWKTRTGNPGDCKNTLYNCVQIICNLSVLLEPFLPFSSERIINWLNVKNKWEIQFVEERYQLPEITVLFERI